MRQRTLGLHVVKGWCERGKCSTEWNEASQDKTLYKPPVLSISTHMYRIFSKETLRTLDQYIRKILYRILSKEKQNSINSISLLKQSNILLRIICINSFTTMYYHFNKSLQENAVRELSQK